MIPRHCTVVLRRLFPFAEPCDYSRHLLDTFLTSVYYHYVSLTTLSDLYFPCSMPFLVIFYKLFWTQYTCITTAILLSFVTLSKSIYQLLLLSYWNILLCFVIIYVIKAIILYYNFILFLLINVWVPVNRSSDLENERNYYMYFFCQWYHFVIVTEYSQWFKSSKLLNHDTLTEKRTFKYKSIKCV